MSKTETERKTQILNLLWSLRRSNPNDYGYYIPPSLSKKIYSLIYIKADIERAQTGVKYLIDEIAKLTHEVEPATSSMYELIWHAIIINYARCFVGNKGGFRKLENSIFADSTELLTFHQELIDLRHEYVAHRDDSIRLEAALGLFVSPKDTKNYKFEVQIQHTRFDPADLRKYEELFDYVSVAIDQIVKKELLALKQKLVSLGNDHLLQHDLLISIYKLSGNT